MNNQELIQEINKNLGMVLPQDIAVDELQEKMGEYLNELIQNNFDKLIMLLYRIDVSEQKLKQLLQQQPQQDAGKMIARLIIERQLQKIKSRQQFSPRGDDFTSEEKW